MKKKNFVTLELGVIGGLLFGIGLCMCLLPEWNAFDTGVIVTAIGAISLLVLLAVRWKLDGKQFNVNGKLVGKIAFGTTGALVLGTGMGLIMVWKMIIPGILLGVLGMVLLLCLIPMCLGLK